MKLLDVLAWVATCLQIAGALVLATRIRPPFWAYAIMLPGAVIWLGIATYRADWALAAMQYVFTVLNAIGLWQWRPRVKSPA